MIDEKYNILTTTEGPHTAAELTALVVKEMRRGLMLKNNLVTAHGLVMQAVRVEEKMENVDWADIYEVKLIQAISANDMTTQVRDLLGSGWDLMPDLGSVAGTRHLFQWMQRLVQA